MTRVSDRKKVVGLNRKMLRVSRGNLKKREKKVVCIVCEM